MKVFTDTGACERFIAERSAPGSTPTVLIPTMGALHRGHAELIRAGVRLAQDRGFGAGVGGCIVSIFVNPTQFGPHEDFARYPRTLDADVALSEAAGAEVVFAPPFETVYPPPPAAPIATPPLPDAATRPQLEDAFRPGHFQGVCQVVQRLFDLVRPVGAIFGEKDWQQLQVVRAMTGASLRPVEIVSLPTVREVDDLAMSSRNRFLSAADRERALSLSRALVIASSVDDADRAEAAMRRRMSDAGVEVEYAAIRKADTLRRSGPVRLSGSSEAGTQFRALVAGRVGSVRLIDNAGWPGHGLG